MSLYSLTSRPNAESNLPLTANTSIPLITFIVGSSNKFAHAALWAWPPTPSNATTPVYIRRVGPGKTHLLYAICSEVSRNMPEKKILVVKGGSSPMN